MDPVLEIKARLPIEELVSQYCQVIKKGRQLKCVCPFHNDKHPSMLISPDKGIAYCFACSSGGDVFSFYQKIEGVDFRQAIKDLADKTGVELPKESMAEPAVKKDEKERMRDCLEAAQKFYSSSIATNDHAKKYIVERKLSKEQIEQFDIGVAPDSFTATYDHLLKAGFSKTEIIGAGLAIQKEMEGKMYDRFRNRLMFPIFDTQGRIVGFGGRTLADDDAKYINSSEGPLYHKSTVLYGYHKAKDAMRESKSVVMVEGYFDVLACHKVGIQNVIAVSGTALTEQHAKMLTRNCETVVLCLDQDAAGKKAAERAFELCSKEGLLVKLAVLEQKDPDEAANANPDALKEALTTNAVPYLDFVLVELSKLDVSSADGRRAALQRALPLIESLSTATDKEFYIGKLAALLGVTTNALQEDLESIAKNQFVPPSPPPSPTQMETANKTTSVFSKVDIALATFLLYPQYKHLIEQIIEPTEEFQRCLYLAIQEVPEGQSFTVETLDIPPEHKEKAAILQLFCENYDFGSWSELIAVANIKKQCMFANQEMLKKKSLETIAHLKTAHKGQKAAELEKLNTTVRQELKLKQMSQ